MVAPATITVFDTLYSSAGVAIAGVTVNCVLNGGQETTTGGLISPVQQSTVTDGTGRFAFTVVCNDLLSPANSTYTIQTPFRTYDIAPQSANGNSQQTTAANVIVNTPTPLAPSTSNITGNLTITGTLGVSGLISANGGLTVTGTFTLPAGGFSMAGPLTLTAAASQIIPGATSMSLRNNANTQDNLLVTDAGDTTVRGALAVTGGGFTLSAGAISMGTATSQLIAGATNFAIRNNANSANNLLLSNAGVATIRAGLTVTAGGATVTAGDVAITAGKISMAAVSSQLVPGATSFSLRNNGNSADNLILTDAGLATFRNAVSVPPSAGASLPATAYGTLPVKLDEQTSTGASLTLTVPAGTLYSVLEIELWGRSDQGGAQVLNMNLNADGGANYDTEGQTNSNAATTFIGPTIAAATARVGAVPGTGAAAGAIGYNHIVISNANSTALRKNWHYHHNRFNTDAAGGAVDEWGMGQWRNAANGITAIALGPAAGLFVGPVKAVLYGRP